MSYTVKCLTKNAQIVDNARTFEDRVEAIIYASAQSLSFFCAYIRDENLQITVYRDGQAVKEDT